MGYYAAGGYYSAGGWFKKLVKGVSKLSTFVGKTPLLQTGLAFIPGAAGALKMAGGIASMLPGGASHTAAIQQSNVGTPGLNAFAAAGGRTRRRRRIRRIRRPANLGGVAQGRSVQQRGVSIGGAFQRQRNNLLDGVMCDAGD